MDWRNKLPNIQNKVKFQLHAKKIDDLESLYKLIKDCDTDNSGYLDKAEFIKFLTRLGIFLTTQELRVVYDAFDTNRDGNICYAEFVRLIRNTMSERRLSLVKHAFEFLDVYKQKTLPLDFLKTSFKAQAHPRVRSRQKTTEQVRDEFERSIVKKSNDGINISEAEFLEYYADVNSTLPNEKEEYFADVIISTWGVTASESYVSPERLHELETILYEKIRQKTFTKEDEGKTARKAFTYFDLEGKGVVSLKQFSDALRKFGCVFSEVEITALFQKFDSDQSGKLAYDEFCSLFALKGAGINPNVNPVFTLSREPPYSILLMLKNTLINQGENSIHALNRIFKKADKHKTNCLSRNEFAWVVKEAGFSLTKTELDNIFRFFDKNCDDKVDYSEFLSFLRQDLNENRLVIVKKAWEKLDKKNEGKIGVEELKTYNPIVRVDFRNAKIKKEDAIKEFIEMWDLDKKNPYINFNQFYEFYQNLSAALNNDEQFNSLVAASWDLN